MKIAAYLILSIFLLSFTARGQTQESNASITSVNLDRTITLSNNSKSEEVLINIEKQTKSFELKISSSVIAGELTIEIYDSNGNKQGNFSLGTQLDSEKDERVNGDIRKSLREPQPGNWKVKIIPTEAKGTVRIQTFLH